jgi:hypothetical protein
LFAVAGSAPCWAGDVVWDPDAILVSAFIGLGGWYSYSGWRLLKEARASGELISWSSFLLGNLVRGVALGWVLLVTGLLSWLAMEIVCGGWAGVFLRFTLGLAFGGSLGWFGAWLGRRRVSVRREWWRKRALGLGLLVLLALVVLYAFWTGPQDLSQYPHPAQSPYLLPWPAETKYLCVQGNRAIVSHRGREQFAYDFAMPVGSDVCAARAGTIVRIVTENDGHGPHAENNFICVDHGETYGWYLHIRKEGSYVRVGDRIVQGQRIAASGHVGISMLPHLHIQVTDVQGRTLPFTFADVPGDGIPRMFVRYASGNRPCN